MCTLLSADFASASNDFEPCDEHSRALHTAVMVCGPVYHNKSEGGPQFFRLQRPSRWEVAVGTVATTRAQSDSNN